MRRLSWVMTVGPVSSQGSLWGAGSADVMMEAEVGGLALKLEEWREALLETEKGKKRILPGASGRATCPDLTPRNEN